VRARGEDARDDRGDASDDRGEVRERGEDAGDDRGDAGEGGGVAGVGALLVDVRAVSRAMPSYSSAWSPMRRVRGGLSPASAARRSAWLGRGCAEIGIPSG
jgi:hypothetical protein